MRIILCLFFIASCTPSIYGTWKRCEDFTIKGEKTSVLQILKIRPKEFTMIFENYVNEGCRPQDVVYLKQSYTAQYELHDDQVSFKVRDLYFSPAIVHEYSNELRACGFDDWKEGEWRKCNFDHPTFNLVQGQSDDFRLAVSMDELVMEMEDETLKFTRAW